MSAGAAYASAIAELHAAIVAANGDPVARAAGEIATRVRDDRLVHVMGPGAHSQLTVQEVFYRPGLLAAVSPIFDEATLLTGGAFASTTHERTPGRAEALLEQGGVGEGDVVLLVSAFGVNATVVEAARAARRRGALLVGYSSTRCEAAIGAEHPARYEAGTALSGLADVHVDTLVPPGDATPLVSAPDTLVPLATTASAFAVTWTLLDAAEAIAAAGDAAPVWASSNLAGGDATNRQLAERYAERVSAL